MKRAKNKTDDFSTDAARNADFVLECTAHRPLWAVILGSGFSCVADRLERWAAFPYEMFRGLPAPEVKGHEGRLIVGLLGGVPVAAFSGRPHPYETGSFDSALMPVRIAAEIGVKNIILTNAAGGLDARMRAGDLMLIEDQINLMPSAFKSFPADESLNSKPAPLHEPVFDRELSAGFAGACVQKQVRCLRGVYAGLSGPCYETEAETRWLRTLGADAVGMSTVHEAIEARRLGMSVLGVSCISNVIGGEHGDYGPDHDSVLENASRSASSFADALEMFLNE
ncbi:MAG: purine-nucleoside phosphorylase [bacterium]